MNRNDSQHRQYLINRAKRLRIENQATVEDSLIRFSDIPTAELVGYLVTLRDRADSDNSGIVIES